MVNGFSGTFVTKVTEVRRFKNSWPTITSAQSSRNTLKVESKYKRPGRLIAPVTLPIVCSETSEEAIPIDTNSVLTGKPRRLAILSSIKFSEAPESIRTSTDESSREPLMTADSKLCGALGRTG